MSRVDIVMHPINNETKDRLQSVFVCFKPIVLYLFSSFLSGFC